jgi:hypothetical protein
LPFLQPGDVGHKNDLTVDDIEKMHTTSTSSISVPTTTIQTRSRGQVLCRRSLQLLPRHQIRGRTYHFLIRGIKG